MNAFFNTHPVFPPIAIAFNMGACIPILFLLLIVRKTPLHSNCRFLCNTWLIGYLALFNASIALWIASLLDENGYLAQSLKNPPHRLLLYEICTSCSLFVTVCEIAIALERIISTTDAEQYYNTPLASRVLVTYVISLITFAYFFGRIVFEYNQFIVGGTILLSCDILTLVTNTLSVRYTKERFEAAFVNLNAKYQVKESYQMSAAMQPVYIAIYIVKCVIGTSSVICLSTGNPYAIGYNDMFYSTANAICASIVCIMLIRKHPLLKRHARLWLGIKNSTVSAKRNSLVDTEQHFEALKEYWK